MNLHNKENIWRMNGFHSSWFSKAYNVHAKFACKSTYTYHCNSVIVL